MNIILLSGGSGKSLWPLSNNVRSKQFIKLYRNSRGEYESMIQRISRQLYSVDPGCQITVATSKSQASTVINQLGVKVDISAEPERRNTFPAVVLAAEYLRYINGTDLNETVTVCPVDLYVDDSFFSVLKKMNEYASENDGAMLLGVVPKHVSSRYGYIVPQDEEEISSVSSFIEKPSEDEAAALIEQGALWNSGIITVKLGYLLETAHQILSYEDYDDLYNRYASVQKISMDNVLVKNLMKMNVLKCEAKLNDLGTWASLTSVTADAVIGNAVVSDTCENVHIINDMDIPVLALGLKNVVVAASQQGILVSSIEESVKVAKYVGKLDQQVMFAEKSWGALTVLDVSDHSATIKLNIKAGKRMSYHSHEHRDEVWMIISGTGRTVVDGMEQPVQAGDVVTMQSGCRHTIMADTDLDVIEIQRGEEINLHDKHKYELE